MRFYLAFTLGILCGRSPAAEFMPPAPLTPDCRYLFLIDTSAGMAPLAESLQKTMHRLIASGLEGQMVPDEVFTIWTYNDTVYQREFPLNAWKAELNAAMGERALQFIQAQRFRRNPNMSAVLNAINQARQICPRLMIILVTNGREVLVGTPFDRQVNVAFGRRYEELRAAKTPFVVSLGVANGTFITGGVQAGNEPYRLPVTSDGKYIVGQAKRTAPIQPANVTVSVPPISDTNRPPIPSPTPIATVTTPKQPPTMAKLKPVPVNRVVTKVSPSIAATPEQTRTTPPSPKPSPTPTATKRTATAPIATSTSSTTNSMPLQTKPVAVSTKIATNSPPTSAAVVTKTKIPVSQPPTIRRPPALINVQVVTQYVMVPVSTKANRPKTLPLLAESSPPVQKTDSSSTTATAPPSVPETRETNPIPPTSVPNIAKTPETQRETPGPAGTTVVNMATSPTPASQPASTTPLVVEAPTSGPEVQSNQPINTAGQELNPNKRPPGNLAIGQAGGTRGITTWIYLAAGSLVLLIAISMTKSMVKQPDEPSLISQSMEDRNNG